MFGARQATGDNMAHAYCIWITKATNTHSEHVIFVALPLQQWLQEGALMLRYTYIDCLLASEVLTWLADGQQNCMTDTYCVYTVLRYC